MVCVGATVGDCDPRAILVPPPLPPRTRSESISPPSPRIPNQIAQRPRCRYIPHTGVFVCWDSGSPDWLTRTFAYGVLTRTFACGVLARAASQTRSQATTSRCRSSTTSSRRHARTSPPPSCFVCRAGGGFCGVASMIAPLSSLYTPMTWILGCLAPLFTRTFHHLRRGGLRHATHGGSVRLGAAARVRL